jgi:ABC-type uncharacterized transport system ATPase subunit
VRWLLNVFRGIDSFVFALILVAAVGLGPFAGLLGVALHTWGSAAKLFAEQIETMSLANTEALEAGGAGRVVAFRYGLLPELASAWDSVGLYLFEFNVRASTVLGVVGAGGIGQELKSRFAAVIGPSGAGKTTLLRLLAGLDRPDGGTVDFRGEPRRAQRGDARVALVFQRPRLIGRLSAIENVLGCRLGRLPRWRGLLNADRVVELRDGRIHV